MSEKRGFLRRMRNAGLRKIGLGEQQVEIEVNEKGEERVRIHRSPLQLMHASVREGWRQAGLKPRRWDMAGWRGRYEDGGRAAFCEQMEKQGRSAADLPEIARIWRKQSLLYGAGALVSVVIAFLFVIREGTLIGLLLAFGILCIAGLLASLALAADFSRWRIDRRRMGGFGEYLDELMRLKKAPPRADNDVAARGKDEE